LAGLIKWIAGVEPICGIHGIIGIKAIDRIEGVVRIKLVGWIEGIIWTVIAYEGVFSIPRCRPAVC
jgi:hypothetical protein